ncbi:capsule biosynthesis protein [Jannaschia pohangensis]|uniref:Capsular polysaccharide transport system permease protein n=1 Tax=Jannaschia pohangensis TaxID=390807 RepID=A0A1I3SDJ9_9RHOB|nr:capsule biosynthesis protein [Jannaschia pohangensis]SFJ55689.1 capsular polysaccharide transport system permease protein [Jannaschia pohangensis]
MPKAVKFRIRPDGSFNRPGVRVPAAMPQASAAPVASAPPANDSAPASLTGRQLRMARRIAQKHGIQVNSDREAVEALRQRGIDPFERSNMIQLVPGQTAKPAEAAEDAPAPQVPAVARTAPLPAQPNPLTIDSDTRASEIVKIQRDIARRRRRRLALLASRLAFFVGLPTVIAGIYYFVIATPMYATKSEFIIQQADAASAGASGLGGLFSGTGLATQQDSISVQSYLLSRDALERLDAELGFTSHFSSDAIDALQQLDADASREQAYRLYKRMVQIGYDPTEGVIKMEVVAADPEVSAAFSTALISYAEEQVDQLTARLRGDQMAGAEDSFRAAEDRMLASQNRVVELQEKLGVVSEEAEVTNIYTQIGQMEGEIRAERLRLDQLLSNARPNQARVDVSRQAIARLEAEVEGLRASLTDDAADDASLARVTAELQIARQELVTRQLLLQQSAQQLELARIEANRQVRYLSTPVPPIAPDEPTYPRAFENTLLAFLIFAGIYLMVSLTAAILREQVSG